MDYLIPAKIIREHPSCNGVLEIDTICGPHWVCAKEFYESARAGPAASQPAKDARLEGLDRLFELRVLESLEKILNVVDRPL